MIRDDEVPARVIIAEIVCTAGLVGLNFSFLATLPMEFGRGFQVAPMILAEVVTLFSLGLIAYACLFVLFAQWSSDTAPRALWTYIFGAIWLRVLAFCSLLALASEVLKSYLDKGTGKSLPLAPLVWGILSGCLALTVWARVRRMRKKKLFAEADERIRQQGEWFKTRFVNCVPVGSKRLCLSDMPSVILFLLFFFLAGLTGLVFGITALGRHDPLALVPLFLGGLFTALPFYGLALLASRLRNKPLTIVAILERDWFGAQAAKPDPLSGQRWVLALAGLLSLVPLALSSVQATWGGFIFAVVAGGAGFVGLDIMRKRLAKRQKAMPMEIAEFEHIRQRLARRGCDYGLLLLVGGLLVVTLAPGIMAWGTGTSPVAKLWGKFAFPGWAWLMLAALSSWYEKVVKPVWPEEVDPTPGLRITEIITWPFQLFFLLNPWELLVRLYARLKR